MATICNLESGRRGVVRSVNADEIIRQRLFDMGILPNIEITKERAALGGDPIWIRVGSVQLALRKNEAESVNVEAV